MLALVFFLATLTLPILVRAEAHIILSDSGRVYQEVAEVFESQYGKPSKTNTWLLASLSKADLRKLSMGPDLLVPVGMAAVQAIAENYGDGNASVLALLVSREAFASVAWPWGRAGRRASAVYLDQPVGRSLDLVELLFPQARRIGVVISEGKRGLLKGLEIEAARRKLSVQVEVIGSPQEATTALRRVLSEADVLLQLPDGMVANEGNIQNLLLMTYRYRVPMITFSRGLVASGGLAATYSTPGQIARQGVSMALRRNASSGDLPESAYASDFSLALNRSVARSLGLALMDGESVMKRLGAESIETPR